MRSPSKGSTCGPVHMATKMRTRRLPPGTSTQMIMKRSPWLRSCTASATWRNQIGRARASSTVSGSPQRMTGTGIVRDTPHPQNTRYHGRFRFPTGRCILFRRLSVYPPRRHTISPINFTMSSSVSCEKYSSLQCKTSSRGLCSKAPPGQ